jgi:hypothetical protein
MRCEGKTANGQTTAPAGGRAYASGRWAVKGAAPSPSDRSRSQQKSMRMRAYLRVTMLVRKCTKHIFFLLSPFSLFFLHIETQNDEK